MKEIESKYPNKWQQQLQFITATSTMQLTYNGQDLPIRPASADANKLICCSKVSPASPNMVEITMQAKYDHEINSKNKNNSKL